MPVDGSFVSAVSGDTADGGDIRTYAVMPLNEECGLLEWVSNTKAMKSILEKEYTRYGKKIYVSGRSHSSRFYR